MADSIDEEISRFMLRPINRGFFDNLGIAPLPGSDVILDDVEEGGDVSVMTASFNPDLDLSCEEINTVNQGTPSTPGVLITSSHLPSLTSTPFVTPLQESQTAGVNITPIPRGSREIGIQTAFTNNSDGSGLSTKSTPTTKENSLLTCPECKITIKRKDNFIRHMQKHKGFKHKCPGCPLLLRSTSELRQHIDVVHNNKRYQCDEAGCGNMYKSKQSLAQHMQQHNDQWAYRCEVCKQGFSQKDQLAGHLNSKHSNSKPHICQRCNRGFAWKSGLIIHSKICSPKEGENKVDCETYGKSFKHAQSLKRHQKSHSLDTLYICHNCGKNYSFKNSFAYHIKKCNAQ